MILRPQISGLRSITALGRLADFLHNVCSSVESSDTLISPEAFKSLDPLIQSLNRGSEEYFVEPATDPTFSNLIPHPLASEKSCKYPLLKIDMSVCRDAIVSGNSTNQILFVIARFLEKTFCRIIELPASARWTPSNDVVSHIGVLLDYSRISSEVHHSNALWSANKSVSEALFAFGPVIIRAVLVVGAQCAGASLWKPLSVGLSAGSDVRFIMCETMKESTPWIHRKG